MDRQALGTSNLRVRKSYNSGSHSVSLPVSGPRRLPGLKRHLIASRNQLKREIQSDSVAPFASPRPVVLQKARIQVSQRMRPWNPLQLFFFPPDLVATTEF
jgi:hypothetical protein